MKHKEKVINLLNNRLTELEKYGFIYRDHTDYCNTSSGLPDLGYIEVPILSKRNITKKQMPIIIQDAATIFAIILNSYENSSLQYLDNLTNLVVEYHLLKYLIDNIPEYYLRLYTPTSLLPYIQRAVSGVKHWNSSTSTKKIK